MSHDLIMSLGGERRETPMASDTQDYKLSPQMAEILQSILQIWPIREGPFIIPAVPPSSHDERA